MMKVSKLNEDQWVDITLNMGAIDMFKIFLAAYVKLAHDSGLLLGEVSSNEEKLTIHFKGRIDNLCHIWYATGALMERAQNAD